MVIRTVIALSCKASIVMLQPEFAVTFGCGDVALTPCRVYLALIRICRDIIIGNLLQSK
jgi:hypothetical protein